uniref:ribonuclease H n=1 Tax=Pyxicephalus adspersus TaxID=30357 RepID=A0AAV3A260_PYXAD|nr:TPA: hypothetical protein GDO54_016699 [Pyxicephalus adspersus]
MAFPPGTSSKNFIWTEEEPFKDRNRVIPQKEVQDLRQQLTDLTDAGIIHGHQTIPRPPKGTKINKMVKFCMDYYWYKNQKIPDLVLGMVSELGQVPMYPGERENPYTLRPLGFYETERMQPGYCDMLATFQKLMGYIFRDLNMVDLLILLDYIIVFGTTFEEHKVRLQKTLNRLQKEGYKVSAVKSTFCSTSFGYIGHLISEQGITIAPEKVKLMSAWPKPKTVTELKSFLEFCGYYQHFYKDFGKISKPLTKLLQDVAADKQKDEEAIPKLPWWTRESIEERWTKECSEAFRSLKACITHAPVLERVNMSQRLPYRYW